MSRFPPRTLALLVAIAVTAGLSTTVAITQTSRGPEGQGAAYNVTFEETLLDVGNGGGWARYGAAFDLYFNVTDMNLTSVSFTFAWSDTVGSPIRDPTVQLTLKAPNGTVIYDGPAPATQTTWTTLVNSMPQSATVRSHSPEEAIAKAAPALNQTLGTGLWNWTLKVGDMPFARNQIRSGINFNDGYGWSWMNGTANALAP
jgi:hypothetical protein